MMLPLRQLGRFKLLSSAISTRYHRNLLVTPDAFCASTWSAIAKLARTFKCILTDCDFNVKPSCPPPA